MSPDSERDPSIPKAFEVIGEHYKLVRKLGEGAFGVVYEAKHDLLGQSFAVKILKPELCEDENLRERFLDEARALIRFSHTNVVQLRHVGEHRGRLYLVMDLVKGEALNDLLQREGALGEERSVDVIRQVRDACPLPVVAYTRVQLWIFKTVSLPTVLQAATARLPARDLRPPLTACLKVQEAMLVI